jgi:branched-chain amino acid transport system permease protein
VTTSTTESAPPRTTAARRSSPWGKWRGHPFVWGLVVAVVAAIAGLGTPSVIGNSYYTGLALSGVILAMLAVGIGFLSRHLGLISLGHTAIFGSAAYGLAIANTRWHWGPLQSGLFGLAAGVAVAVVIAALVVRATGMGFLMLTLALGQALYQLIVLSDARPYTGAFDGLSLAFPSGSSFLGVSSDNLFDARDFWPIAWIALVASAFVLWAAGRTRFGTILHGIRENEERMRFSGYNTYAPRFWAFVLSGVVASLGGVLFGLNAGTITPDIVGFQNAGQSLVAGIVGGLGTVVGPIVGALLYVYAQSKFSTSGNLELYTGIALIVVLAFLRGGITGSIALGVRRLWALRKGKAEED